MERKVGEVFEYNGIKLKVVECENVEEFFCGDCFFQSETGDCCVNEKCLGYCSYEYRKDNKDIIFKRV